MVVYVETSPEVAQFQVRTLQKKAGLEAGVQCAGCGGVGVI